MTKTERTKGPWTYEVHELSEGYSAIVYDEHGQMIADHLTEDRARLIVAAPELVAALDYIQMHSNEKAIREKAASALSQTGAGA